MDEDEVVYGESKVSNFRVGCVTAMVLTGAYLIMFKLLVQSASMCHAYP